MKHGLGYSVPLIAATVSTLLLVGTLVWPLIFPERAKIVVEPASPAYALNALRLDIANLSDLEVMLPSRAFCHFEGDLDFLRSRFSSVSVQNGKAYSTLELRRSADSAVGLRNQSARIRYEADPKKQWGAPGTRGKMNCMLRLEDRHGALESVVELVAFEINDAGLILYNLTQFHDSQSVDPSAGLFFGPRNELLGSPEDAALPKDQDDLQDGPPTPVDAAQED